MSTSVLLPVVTGVETSAEWPDPAVSRVKEKRGVAPLDVQPFSQCKTRKVAGFKPINSPSWPPDDDDYTSIGGHVKAAGDQGAHTNLMRRGYRYFRFGSSPLETRLGRIEHPGLQFMRNNYDAINRLCMAAVEAGG